MRAPRRWLKVAGALLVLAVVLALTGCGPGKFDEKVAHCERIANGSTQVVIEERWDSSTPPPDLASSRAFRAACRAAGAH